MLENFWYAVEFSQALSDRPQLVQIFGQQIALFRDSSGKAQALNNICPHRGASLGLGKVQDNCLVCPYHGWHFAGNGQCVKIPSNLPGATIPQRAQVKTYPVREKDGWIWLFWGDATIADTVKIPDIPQVDEVGLRSITGDFHWHVNYERAMDNGLDFAMRRL
ncbi:MAG: Rieske 2Fe-2S domain-containing protein, partial [Alkalinema sp. RL_2_19]|nr:Rieske 2Fe-2S domain-containing protein [Alkalinema sp. RL_2_19]